MGFHKIIVRGFLMTAAVTVMSSSMAFGAINGQIVGTDVNVRVSNDTSADVVDKLNDGASLTILGKSDDWYQVSYEGAQQAYVSSQFVKVVNATGVVKDNGVNIRKTPSMDGEVVTKVNSGDSIAVTGQSGNWYQISINGGQAYISKDFVAGNLLDVVQEISPNAQAPAVSTYAIVTSDNGLKLRESNSTSSNAITTLPYNEIIDVLTPGNEWIQVKTESGQVGYVSAEFVSIRTGEKPSRSNSSKGDQIVAYAKQFIGTPYVWGGTNLNKGVDCSGFVYAVMKNFGITLNRSSSGMLHNGVPVEKSQLVAGDLVLFDTTGPNNGGISHVGIYIGNGDYIHSSSGKAWGVTISNLYEDYSARTYVTARRVLR